MAQTHHFSLIAVVALPAHSIPPISFNCLAVIGVLESQALTDYDRSVYSLSMCKIVWQPTYLNRASIELTKLLINPVPSREHPVGLPVLRKGSLEGHCRWGLYGGTLQDRVSLVDEWVDIHRMMFKTHTPNLSAHCRFFAILQVHGQTKWEERIGRTWMKLRMERVCAAKPSAHSFSSSGRLVSFQSRENVRAWFVAPTKPSRMPVDRSWWY